MLFLFSPIAISGAMASVYLDGWIACIHLSRYKTDEPSHALKINVFLHSNANSIATLLD